MSFENGKADTLRRLRGLRTHIDMTIHAVEKTNDDFEMIKVLSEFNIKIGE